MTQVQFYHLHTNTRSHITDFLVRLVTSLFETKQSLDLWFSDDKLLQELSRALWAAPGRFLAHECSYDSTLPANPHSIILCAAKDLLKRQETLRCTQDERIMGVLINMSHKLPPLDLKFPRIVELVWESPEQKADARQRYSAYLQQGQKPQYLRIE